MANTVALLLGVHAHQPVGNFKEVLDDAHARCYGPFLRVLHEYPDFKFSIHISGWLLEYMLVNYAEDMALLKIMVDRGQAELVGAGFTEPVLAAIPVRDRIGQLTYLSRYLERKLGQAPHGAWLTERVWESTVVPALADSGIQYVMVDDYHFMCTGQSPSALNGYYTTEEDGRQVDLFPISEALRYRLPFAAAHEAVAYIESLADESKQSAAVYFDDIEKFGIWPETYNWVYERGWLRNFIEGVLASPMIKPMRYVDYHAMAKTKGVVYLPTASYIEMNEWTLPVPAAHHYADLVGQEKQNHRYEINKPFVRGGIWRNFFMRYPESNWMHKRMLALSDRFHGLPENMKTNDMRNALYEAQANDAYWHGLFGGLYLPHLRRAVYRALLALEQALDSVSPRPSKLLSDLDLDGNDELFLQNGQLQAVVRADGSASVSEFDSYRLHHNFGDTLTRQAEHYHRKVHAQPDHASTGEGISNPHERVSLKHEITQADLEVDTYRKTLFCDSILMEDNAFSSLHYKPATGRGNTVLFKASHKGVTVLKEICLQDNALLVNYDFNVVANGVFRVEINLAMPSCDGPAGRFRIGDHVLGGFGQAQQGEELQVLHLEDEVLGGKLTLESNLPCKWMSHPHFSVSQSEAGFEKIMQAVTLQLEWSVSNLVQPLQIKLAVD